MVEGTDIQATGPAIESTNAGAMGLKGYETGPSSQDILGYLISTGMTIHTDLMGKHKEYGLQICLERIQRWEETAIMVMREMKLPAYYITQFQIIDNGCVIIVGMNCSLGARLIALKKKIRFLAVVSEKIDTKQIMQHNLINIGSIFKNAVGLDISIPGIPEWLKSIWDSMAKSKA